MQLKICMIGAGYVGLVSAACLAEFGWTFSCVDKDADRIAALKRGNIPIYEPGLDALLERGTNAGRLSFSALLSEALNDVLMFLAVGTPMRGGDGQASSIIATKSTVPVGTSREIKRQLHELRPDLDVVGCSNPEFLHEGSAIRDFTHPDRVLVGCEEPRGREVKQRLYQPLALRNAPIVFVSPEVKAVGLPSGASCDVQTHRAPLCSGKGREDPKLRVDTRILAIEGGRRCLAVH